MPFSAADTKQFGETELSSACPWQAGQVAALRLHDPYYWQPSH